VLVDEQHPPVLGATSTLTFADRTRSRAIRTASGAASIAVTVSAGTASASVHRPVPHAISNTLPDGRIRATSRAMRARAAATSPYAVTSYSPARRR
jgi:hypothetical protein